MRKFTKITHLEADLGEGGLSEAPAWSLTLLEAEADPDLAPEPFPVGEQIASWRWTRS